MRCFSKPLQTYSKIQTFIKLRREQNIKTKCLLEVMRKIYCYNNLQINKILKLIIILIGHINHLHQ